MPKNVSKLSELDALLAKLEKSAEEAAEGPTFTLDPSLSVPSDAVAPEDGALAQANEDEIAQDHPLSIDSAVSPETLNSSEPGGPGTSELSASDGAISTESTPIPTEGEMKNAAYIEQVRKLASVNGVRPVIEAVGRSLDEDFQKLSSVFGELEGQAEFNKRAEALNADLASIDELAEHCALFMKSAADEALAAAEAEAAAAQEAGQGEEVQGEPTAEDVEAALAAEGEPEVTAADLEAALAEAGAAGGEADLGANPESEQDIEAVSQALMELGVTPEELVQLAQVTEGDPEAEAVKQASVLACEVNRRRNQAVIGRAPVCSTVGTHKKVASVMTKIKTLKDNMLVRYQGRR